jgi:hypothetical protein
MHVRIGVLPDSLAGLLQHNASAAGGESAFLRCHATGCVSEQPFEKQ